jgi:flagellar basal body rod protein FlgC
MPLDLGGVTAATVRLALDVAQMRHQVIANNLANVRTSTRSASTSIGSSRASSTSTRTAPNGRSALRSTASPTG